MYTLFNKPPVAKRGTRQPSFYAYVKRGLRENLVQVLRYCRESNHAVESDHLLVNILRDLNVSPNLSIFEYYDKVSERAYKVAKANGITSSLWKGNVLKDGVFYGKDTVEIIMAVNEPVDVLSVERSWKSLQPVRVLRHPKTSLSLEPIVGNESLEEYGIAVVQIDIVQLALQYRQWYLQQAAEGVAFFETPMQFVFQYPLANALLSHHDIAIVNRLYRLYDGGEPSPIESTWPFYLKDFSEKTDKYLLDRVANLVRASFPFEQLLLQVELPVVGSMYDAIELPKTVHTRQIVWAFAIARIPVISMLLQLDNDVGGERNKKERSELRKTIKELRQDRDLTSGISPEIGQMFMQELEEKIEKYL